MNYLKLFFEKMDGRSVSNEKLDQIKEYVDVITASELAINEENMEGLGIYRYTDEFFSVVKTYVALPNGSCEVNRGIILSNNTQVYNGTNAISINLWLDHLCEVYMQAKSLSRGR